MDQPTDRQTKATNQTDWLTDRQTNKQMSKRTDKERRKQAN
jgi:hypothetical protein